MSSKKKLHGRSQVAAAMRRLRSDISSADAAAATSSIAAAAPSVSTVTAAAAAAAASPTPLNHARGGSSSDAFGSRLLFLTVGTTRFDALVQACNEQADELVSWLVQQGFGAVQLQIGTGTVEPLALRAAAERWNASQRDAPSSSPRSSSSSRSSRAAPTLDVSWFRLSPDLLSLVSRASLVISHAGAGSILEALRRARPLLVVINDKLMHNHQMEVAEALAEGKFLYQTTPHQLMHTLRAANWKPPVDASSDRRSGTDSDTPERYQLQRYPPVQSDAFPRLLDEHVAAVLRPTDTSSNVATLLFTAVMPALLAVIITWIAFS